MPAAPPVVKVKVVAPPAQADSVVIGITTSVPSKLPTVAPASLYKARPDSASFAASKAAKSVAGLKPVAPVSATATVTAVKVSPASTATTILNTPRDGLLLALTTAGWVIKLVTVGVTVASADHPKPSAPASKMPRIKKDDPRQKNNASG